MEKTQFENDKYLQFGHTLREIISRSGKEILTNPDELDAILREKKASSTLSLQLLLFLHTSNFKKYLSQKEIGLSMIDINTLVLNGERTTGMNRDTVKNILIALLYGLSIPTDLATVHIPGNYDKTHHKEIRLSEYDGDRAYLKQIDIAILEKDERKLSDAIPALHRMVQAGNPWAQYYLGLCYYEGICTEKNIRSALELFAASVNGGCIEARAMLGDCFYYGTWDHTKAFEHYTTVGTVALSKKRQKNLKSLIQEKKTNFHLLIFNGILLFSLILFNVFLFKGSFSVDAVKHPVSIFVSVMLALFYGTAVAELKFKPYCSIQWLAPLMLFFQLLFTVFIL